eukprot:3437174-Pyramimonas_sp.AAC.1
MLLQVMGGIQSFKHDLKSHTPYQVGRTSCFAAAIGVPVCTERHRQGNLRAGPPSLRPRPFAALLYRLAAVLVVQGRRIHASSPSPRL